MKHFNLFLLLTSIFFLDLSFFPFEKNGNAAYGQSVGINTTGAAPVSSAMLDVVSTTKGMLIPRMTLSQRISNILTPATGLIIYNLDCNEFQYYDGSTWKSVLNSNSFAATVAISATAIDSNLFTANWNAVTGATDYFLDVASDAAFTTFISGYNNLAVGNVTSKIVNSGITNNTTYYYRVKAGTACGYGVNSNTITVTTATLYTCAATLTDARDGQTYAAVSITGSSSPYCRGAAQCWMAQNLNVGTQVTSVNTGVAHSEQTNNSIIEKYCSANVAANCTTYGGLYDWNEMMAYGTEVSGNGPGPQGICPSGWHLPTDNEWKCMEMNLSGMSQASADAYGYRATDEGNKLKTLGNGALPSWASPSAGTNSSGFSIVPNEERIDDGRTFSDNQEAWFWTTSENGATFAYDRLLHFTEARIMLDTEPKQYGMSVRCIKNYP
jgi:uncharacterized protein (TIGR02145 family)